MNLLRDQEKLLASLSNDLSVPLQFRVEGVVLDADGDDGRPLSATNFEKIGYSMTVSDGTMEYQVELEISE